ncbi:Methionyl-tRNA formyltransferase [compost metagenome]
MFKVWEVSPPTKTSSDHSLVPGTVLQLDKRGIEVKTGDGSIWLTKVQPSGKKALEVDAFIRGTTMVKGTVLT